MNDSLNQVKDNILPQSSLYMKNTNKGYTT